MFRRSCQGWLWSEPIDTTQEVGEQLMWDGHLSHLEDDVAAVANDLCSDLDQLLSERRERPLLDGIGHPPRHHLCAR
ncbi:MAG TPA: hypothetical protein VLU23_09725 [Pseudolabrys sp.]|jgi:hypothetical protein|nr:hypothetical protein [Pseudolabrys sp.]